MAKKLLLEKEEILWKDRKRILGLPISFTRYILSSERLTVKQGFFKTVTDEILVYRIMDNQLVRTLGQKIFGVGTVTLFSNDKTNHTFELKNIRHPEKVRRFLSGLVEEQRVKRGTLSSEFLGGRPGVGHDPSCPDPSIHNLHIDG